MAYRFVKWLAAFLLALPLLAVLFVLIFGWNWARGPLQRITADKTGRELVISGDLKVSLAWPAPMVHANAVTFANPSWAKEKQMLALDDVRFSVDLPALLARKLEFPEVHLIRPVVFLEQAADGRKTWLLDTDQLDEKARIPIGRLTLDRGRIGYDDARLNTSIRADLSTAGAQGGGKDANVATDSTGVVFQASGLYKGLTLAARGSGGSVLGLHDDSTPYPLNVDATVGRTGIKAEGTVTSLLKFTAIDMRLALRGESLAQLYPLFGIALPETNPYNAKGHIVRSGPTWRYEKFSGRIGGSDIAGTLQVDTGGKRPFMRGELISQVLEFDDLGPLIGAGAKRPAPPVPPMQKNATTTTNADPAIDSAPKAAPARATGSRLLPAIPFKTETWNSLDADVTLRAKTLLRAKELPLDNLLAHLKMNDSLLTLEPLDFGFAGGHLKAMISLDGSQNPIVARAKISARKILLAKLFPTVKLTQSSIGQINGEFDLSGKGNSVDHMLGTADGKIALVVADGEISKLLMEKIGLHVLEIVQLSLFGDKTVKLSCGVADFGVKRGVMGVNALVLDTDVSTITGTGSIDLGRETLDLTLVPKTRTTSLIALRSPIHVRGTFSKPEFNLDKGRIATRGAGAVALGLLNPLLALLPLLELGPGVESQCAGLIQRAQESMPTAKLSATGSTPK